MLHEIEPHAFDINMAFVEPCTNDSALLFHDDDDGRSLVKATLAEDGSIAFPTCESFGTSAPFTYLFAIDERAHFLIDDAKFDASLSAGEDTASQSTVQTSFLPMRDLIARSGDPQAFAVATAFHLRNWYRDNRRCGRCGKQTTPSTTERALVCTKCGHTVYPRISPAVIVAVTDGDRLLLTRYAQGHYRKRALVAGFVEVGETPEEAVAREVWEECGLRVKNLRYFASQPWGLSESLMLGFFADLDGDSEITLRDGELDWAGWVPRDKIEDDDDYALGRALINAFLKRGNA